MKTDRFGTVILNETDLMDLVMKNRDLYEMKRISVDSEISLEQAANYLERVPDLIQYAENANISVAEYDQQQQAIWHMPKEYQDLDIAEYILGLCETQEQLQRVGEELLLYQSRGLFDLLKYLKYLVDVITVNRVILGVGRGSSVASYVLYKMGVHKIDSMYYQLDITEFLR